MAEIGAEFPWPAKMTQLFLVRYFSFAESLPGRNALPGINLAYRFRRHKTSETKTRNCQSILSMKRQSKRRWPVARVLDWCDFLLKS